MLDYSKADFTYRIKIKSRAACITPAMGGPSCLSLHSVLAHAKGSPGEYANSILRCQLHCPLCFPFNLTLQSRLPSLLNSQLVSHETEPDSPTEGKRIRIYTFRGKRKADTAESPHKCRLSVQEMTEGK